MENQTQHLWGFSYLLSGLWLTKKPAEFVFGFYIILEESTKPMIEEATTAGY